MSARRAIVAFMFLATGAIGSAQLPEQTSTQFVAFRFDDSRTIAVIKVLDDPIARGTEKGLSAAPAAQFGFPYFDALESQRAHVPPALQSARWVVHAGPAGDFDATVEKVVAGNSACQEAVALLLSIAPSQVAAFKAAPQRYFLAQAQPGPRSDGDAVQSSVRELPRPVLTAGQQRTLESLLDDVMKREWPAIRDETEPFVSRMAASGVGYQQAWAIERRKLAEELSQGRVKLSYDIQAFHLDPGGRPTYFVRAEWLAGRRQAFVAALWLRGDAFEVVESNTRPASWLRTFEFQGAVDRVQLGLVLNVLDLDRDAWGEVVFAHGGYESLSIEVLEYSAGGFQPTGVSFASGC